ncbi:hypothetical protein LWI28_000928 [Acer negundo]|uniref:Wings apart-like protein C-terminal domain-containing protein n=1 Tax=Acer negundo TaxID=4023 RepID=A0AAD5JMS1_ACENE|nr:hypothetical protein LWI28_000928 [Acer negundo]KAK4857768.1 hypothetical protein QYF36_006044 [Acer negundo]
MVRTYGRRNRGSLARTYSDTTLTAEEDDVDLEEDPYRDSFSSISQDTPQDLYNFPFSSSQESSPPRWSSQDNNNSQRSNNSVPVLPLTTTTKRTHFTDSENGVVRRPKKQRKQQGFPGPSIPVTSTLMEAQEFGEMMEHVDEVNFAIDGLKRGSQVRIRRASLLSLLSICGTAQQRRLLRTHGMAKTIIDAIMGLSFDDSPSNLAAAALFYILTGDGQDDHLLESHGCIRFLIKLLKPVSSTATEDKTRKIGSKLLALRKDSDIFRDTTKISDSSSSAILSKVQEILVSCKEMKSCCGDGARTVRPELSPKWMALLTMEKACLSKISFEDTTGTVRKTGGNFKEILRDLGGLDAVFEVIMDCYSVMEGWKEHCSPSIQDANPDLDLQNFVLLLKCLKIMENATFLSKDNQSHLLGMKGNLNSHRSRLSFIKVIIFLIKILSDLYLLRISATSTDEKSSKSSGGTGLISELALLTDDKVGNNEIIVISSSENCSSTGLASSQKSFNASQNSSQLSFGQLGHSESHSETTTTSMNDNCLLKMRSRSSLSGSCSGTLRGFSGGTSLSSNGARGKFGIGEIPNSRKGDKYELLEDSEDPFAFDEDAFELSKWDLLSRKEKKSQTKKSRVVNRGLEHGSQYQIMIMSQEDSSNGENCQQLSSDGGIHQRSSNGEHHCSQGSSNSSAVDKEKSTLLSDCLLTAVKVLMNLTNDNPVGCQQIAACGGLETMSLLIANHFPSFSSSLSHLCVSFDVKHQDDRHLTDQELDFLVAILGLLVNLVEKDGHNRSQLAAARVSLPNSDGLEESHADVITLLCSIFLANRGAAGDAAAASDAAAAGEGNVVTWNVEEAMLEGEKEAEKMIVEAYAALLLAFLSTESKSIRAAIADCLPDHNIAILVPVLERFVTFHLSLNMITPETHKVVSEVIESCRIP